MAMQQQQQQPARQLSLPQHAPLAFPSLPPLRVQAHVAAGASAAAAAAAVAAAATAAAAGVKKKRTPRAGALRARASSCIGIEADARVLCRCSVPAVARAPAAAPNGGAFGGVFPASPLLPPLAHRPQAAVVAAAAPQLPLLPLAPAPLALRASCTAERALRLRGACFGGSALAAMTWRLLTWHAHAGVLGAMWAHAAAAAPRTADA
jgi:hypothetical protein